MEIFAHNEAGSHRTGSLSATLTPAEIKAKLGFGPNIDDDPDKVTMSWGFTVDGVPCGIWDYYRNRWSTFGPHDVFAKLFPDHYGM